MFKFKSLVLTLLLISTSLVLGESGILDKIGNWQVTVGPAGNEFYQIPQSMVDVTPPTKEMIELVKIIAPDYTSISRWEIESEDEYFIRSQIEYEEYDFIITKNGKIIELEYENDALNVSEKPSEMALEGTKKSIMVNDIPQKTLNILAKVMSDTTPSEAWIAETIAGFRYVVRVGETIFYATSNGQIRAAGLVRAGALKEINPKDISVEKSPQEILAEAKNLLGPYQERFNKDNLLKKLGDTPKTNDGHYRFVVMGDSRSNPDLWSNIIKHVDQLNPKPDFVINTGDVVRYGYTQEFLDYYIPELLQTQIPYFIALGNHDDGASGMAIEYRYLFGENSLNFYFDYGKIRFILIDNVTSVQSYQETFKWLERVLAETPKGYKIIVNAHKPTSMVKKWAYHAMDDNSSKIFSDLMSKYRVDRVYFGHIHAYSTARYQGVDYTVAGGGGAGLHDRYGPEGNVHHYLICDVKPDGSIKEQVVRFYKEEK
jgi:hypothetical protein